MKKIIIAIDGFSSTGKSTVAKQLAKALGYVYIDTGAMYRAVALFAMNHNLVGDNFLKEKELETKLNDIQITFKLNPSTDIAEVYLNGKNVEKQIRTLEVSQYVSPIAAISSVRKKLVEQQQKMGAEKGIVMDGRDIGTVVFPEAELKIFMNASAEKRAQRRYDELTVKGDKVNYKEVLKNIEERDEIDTTREDSPLKKASNAIEVNNSNLTLQEQFDKLLTLAKQAIENK